MDIRLTHSIVNKLEFKRNSDNAERDGCELYFTVGYYDDDTNLFAVSFTVKLKSSPDSELDLEYIAYFETSDPIDDEFKASHFPRINAPAIAFPFLRSFIATFMVNAGYKSVILPVVNFTTVEKR